MTIKFVVPIRPEGKRESRSVAVPLKMNGRQIFKKGKPVYTTRQHKDSEQQKYDNLLATEIITHKPEIPFDCPVILTVRIFVQMPSYVLNTWRRDPAEAGIILPDKKPDLSNYLKAIEDIMTRSGYWTDDSRIVRYGADTGKYYSVNPRWEIEVEPISCPRTKKDLQNCLSPVAQ